MMPEDFVTYEQSVKLKELGFDWEYGKGFQMKTYYNYLKILGQFDEEIITTEIPAPTLAQVQKWLREVKGVKVYIKPLFSSEEYEYWISFKFQMFRVGDECYGVEETWEGALSAGINEAIKIIEKEEQRNKRWYE